MKKNNKTIYAIKADLLLVSGNNVCDHAVRDAWADLFSESDFALQ